jgi:hypothetical protein
VADGVPGTFSPGAGPATARGCATGAIPSPARPLIPGGRVTRPTSTLSGRSFTRSESAKNAITAAWKSSEKARKQTTVRFLPTGFRSGSGNIQRPGIFRLFSFTLYPKTGQAWMEQMLKTSVEHKKCYFIRYMCGIALAAGL